MNYPEQTTNTTARCASGGERNRWRGEHVDPELFADPFDVAEEAQAQRLMEEEASCHPLAFAVRRAAERRFTGTTAATGAGVELA